MASTPSPTSLIEECQGLVRLLASRIHRKLPSHVELGDLEAYGQVGLLEAARDFDPTRGGRFSTFAYYRIRGAIYDGLAKMSWFSRTEYRRRRRALLAGDLPGWDADEDGSRVEALADASTPAPPAAAIVREANQRLYELIAALPADAGGLLCAVYFQGLDLQEAGKQLGISKSWASRLHAKTLRQLARDGQLSHSATDVTDSECPAVASGGYEP